jgi:hypothetical protein
MCQTNEKMTVEIEDGVAVEPIAICGMGKLSLHELLDSSHAKRFQPVKFQEALTLHRHYGRCF